MEKRNKHKFTAAFKVHLALDALKGQSTIGESDFGLGKDTYREVRRFIFKQGERKIFNPGR